MYLQPYGALQTLPAEHEAIDALGAIGKRATDESCASGSSPGTSPSGCNYRQGPIYTTIYRTIYLSYASWMSCVCVCESLSNCLLPAAASGSSVDYMYAVNNIVYHLCAPDLQSLSLDNILEQC